MIPHKTRCLDSHLYILSRLKKPLLDHSFLHRGSNHALDYKKGSNHRFIDPFQASGSSKITQSLLFFDRKITLIKWMPVLYYGPNLLFGSLQNISAPVGLIEKLRPLYYIKRPIPLLMSQVIGLWEKLLLNKVEREKNRWPGESVSFVYQNHQR